MELNKIYQGDSLELLKLLPDNSVDLVITSPPYADLKSYIDFKGILADDYVNWFIPYCKEIERVIKPTGSFILNINDKVEFWQMDLVNSRIYDCFEVHQFDYVFHFAAYAAEGLSPFIRQYNYQNNLVATSNIVNECIRHNVKRLIFTSTLAVYGHGYGGIFDESQLPSPIDPYGVAKCACEMDIQTAGEQHGLDWCIIRPHNVYGVKQNIWDKYRNVLGIWMYQYMNDQPMTIFGDGTQKRAFSCIDDILKPLWKSAIEPRASKEIINLGGVEEWSINNANKVLLNKIGRAHV